MRRGKSAVTGASQVTTSSQIIKILNIRTWVHSHTEEETLDLISSGYVIHFEDENLKTSDAMVMTVLQTAYIFFEAERERRSDRAIEAYYRRVEAGVYIPHTLLGYNPGSFTPNDLAVAVRAMYRAVLMGLSCSNIAEWMNQNRVKTVRGNAFTSRAVRQILQNPFYCGDVVFRKAGKVVRDHHTGLVSREVWEAVQERMNTTHSAGEKRTVDITALNALFGMAVSSVTTSTVTTATPTEVEVRIDRTGREVVAA